METCDNTSDSQDKKGDEGESSEERKEESFEEAEVTVNNPSLDKEETSKNEGEQDLAVDSNTEQQQETAQDEIINSLDNEEKEESASIAMTNSSTSLQLSSAKEEKEEETQERELEISHGADDKFSANSSVVSKESSQSSRSSPDLTESMTQERGHASSKQDSTELERNEDESQSDELVDNETKSNGLSNTSDSVSRARGRKALTAGVARPETTRSLMVAELRRTRTQLIRTANSVTRPVVKPYTPDIFNDLSPYYNKHMVELMLSDQEPYYKPWTKYGYRATALGLVSPQTSLSMDRTIEGYTFSKVQAELWTPKVWSKNLSGKGDEFGSTRLPPLPTVKVGKPNNPKYQPLSMTYDEVPVFRREMKSIIKQNERHKSKDDFHRVEMDWKRMNLSELKELPTTSRFHVSKAITTYLGTTRGSMKAVTKLKRDFDVNSDEIQVL